jgi:hypothetical protein
MVECPEKLLANWLYMDLNTVTNFLSGKKKPQNANKLSFNLSMILVNDQGHLIGL